MRHQHLYNIIFSDDRACRRKRHFLFWLAVFFYHLVRIGIMYPALSSPALIISLIWKALGWGVLVNLVVTYTIAYLLVPRFFKRKKYISFFLLSVGILLFVTVTNNVIDYFINPLFRQSIGFNLGDQLLRTLRPGLIRIFGNPPLICCLFLSLKTLKNWHLERLKTETLARENANAELQLLKAQIHPHFLFNTLNNIYSFSLNQSPQAGALVRKLSGMLSYMIHECEGKLVPLEKELSIIRDYTGLEGVRYGKRLQMEIMIHGDFESKLIAPLLLIPFLENSFKHGTSQMLQHPWIKLEITNFGNRLFFKLSNSKPSLVHGDNRNKGIGLLNVKKRLQLLYPGRYQLDISPTEDTFNVNLQILLEEDMVSEDKMIEADKAFAYA